MIWIFAVYLLVGVLLGIWVTLRNLPYVVTVGDVIAAPFLLVIWPVVAVFVVLESEPEVLEHALFTLGGDRYDDED